MFVEIQLHGLFILVTGTDAKEREDYMTEKIREYSMNGALIIGVDNGYGT